MTESEVLSIIDDVVIALSSTFEFGYFDKEDLQQEGRIFALDGLTRWDIKKGASLKTFLYQHVKRRFINLKRNKYQRPVPKDITEDKLERLLKRNDIKRSLMETAESSDEDNKSFEFADAMQQKEMFSLIDRCLPVELRADYRCIMEDVRIPKHRRDRVILALKEILLNEREEEGETE
jgi:DNA-directed RNA polymerase specialized sigma24 family protein